MRHRAVIFDFDGTLMDTVGDLADCMNAVLGEFGFPRHPVEPYNYFVGRGMVNLARAAAPENTPEETLVRMAARMGEIYGENWAHKTRVYPGIMDMLSALKARGLRLAILSNKPDAFTKDMTRHFFPEGIFDFVMGATKGIPIKPDPAGAFLAAEKLGFAPAEIAYLGDTDTDMQTGRAAGMFTVGVTWGFRPLAELVESGAEATIDAPAELADVLEH